MRKGTFRLNTGFLDLFGIRSVLLSSTIVILLVEFVHELNYIEIKDKVEPSLPTKQNQDHPLTQIETNDTANGFRHQKLRIHVYDTFPSPKI